MFFNLILIIDFLADSSFQHKTNLCLINFDNFPDNLIGETMNDDIFLVLPKHNKFFLNVNSH